MLLVKKMHYIPSETEKIVLGHMGYAAYKLWNVGNYEKQNYQKLEMEEYPNWYSQKKRLKDNFFYKNLPSQSAQDVLQQLEEAWKSFFTKKENGDKLAKPPKFKHSKMSVTFLKGAIKQTEKGVIRLTIPKQLKEYLKTLNIDDNYLYLKTGKFLNIDIRELQIQFNKDESFTLLAVYEAVENLPLEDNGNYLSIDMGINNSFTCYDSSGKCFIIKGALTISHYYDKEIAHFQSINALQKTAEGVKYPKPSRKVLKLYKKKRNSLNNFYHQATRYIINYCIENNINTMVVGDITHIRDNKNLGALNQQLHSWSFAQCYQMLEYKAKLAGIKFIKQKEFYTSQCSPNSPGVSKKFAKKNNRISRGLFKDGDKIYNADAVGAYNILRAYLAKNNKKAPGHQGLSSPAKDFDGLSKPKNKTQKVTV